MRMRRKKHLDEKISECTNLFEVPAITTDCRKLIEKKEYINLYPYFNNTNPVHIEIGCGMGQFITELALKNPQINYIAVEINRNVICAACHKAMELHIKNILFLHCPAEILQKYLPEHIAERIYLNFSCPFPKKAYENKRLTNRRFLETYKYLLAEGAEIHQKTDNMHFFEYSLEQFSASGYRIQNVSLDLHNSNFEGNIETEYERRFSRQGMPIYRLEAYLA